MHDSDKETPAVLNQGAFDFISKILVSLMMVCLMLTVSNLIQKIIPTWKTEMMAVFAFLVSLERLFTYKMTKRLVVFSKPWVIFYTSQWITTLIFIKIILMAYDQSRSIWMEIQLWRLDFFPNFFDMETLGSASMILVIWLLSGNLAGLLDEMSLEEALIKYDMSVKAPTGEVPPRERLLGMVFGGGFFLVAVTAILRIEFREILHGGFDNFKIRPLPYMAAGSWNVLLYFVLGLVLISLSQFARLNARWHIQRIIVSTKLAQHWAFYSLISIAVVAILASFLPTNYSLGLLSIISYLIQLVIGFLAFIFGAIGTILLFLFSQLMMVFGGKEPGEEIDLQAYEPPEMPSEVIQPGADPSIEVLRAVIFWITFFLIVGFSVYQFARQHERIWSALNQFPFSAWIKGFYQWLRDITKRATSRLSEVGKTGLEIIRRRRRIQPGKGGGGLISLRRLNPRQRVFYFFLALIQRGSKQGFTRSRAQTPYEYAEILESSLPEVNNDIGSLTDAFVTARYSKKEIEEEEARLVKRYWRRIRGALQSFRK